MEPQERERIAKALADPRRWRILEIARERPGVSCGEVTAELGLSQPTVSHHLSTLVDAGLLLMRRAGTCGYLTVNEKTIARYAAALAPESEAPLL